MWIFPWKMVVFHSFLYVYQRLCASKGQWAPTPAGHGACWWRRDRSPATPGWPRRRRAATSRWKKQRIITSYKLFNSWITWIYGISWYIMVYHVYLSFIEYPFIYRLKRVIIRKPWKLTGEWHGEATPGPKQVRRKSVDWRGVPLTRKTMVFPVQYRDYRGVLYFVSLNQCFLIFRVNSPPTTTIFIT